MKRIAVGRTPAGVVAVIVELFVTAAAWCTTDNDAGTRSRPGARPDAMPDQECRMRRPAGLIDGVLAGELR